MNLNQTQRSEITNIMAEFGYFASNSKQETERNRENFRKIILRNIEISQDDELIFNLIEYNLRELKKCSGNVYCPIICLLVLKYILPEKEILSIEDVIYDAVSINNVTLDPEVHYENLSFVSNWCEQYIIKEESEGFDFDLKEFVNTYIKEHTLKYKKK